MTTVVFIAVAMAILLGLGLKYLLDRLQITNLYNETRRIAWSEFAVVAILMIAVITPSVTAIGKKLSINEIVTYEQFLNGVERQPEDHVVECYEGTSGNSYATGQSNCSFTYVSGSYSWTETYIDNVCTTDGKGNTSCTPVARTETYTGYIYTPYATVEHNYSIPRTVGFKELDTFQFSGAYLDTDPKPFGRKAIPSNLPRGAPKDWLDAKQRWDEGDPRSVTALGSYPNPILASGDEVLNPYSSDIERFRKANMLPAHTANIMKDPIGGPSKSQAKKLSLVGVTLSDEADWQAAVMRFNTALGLKLQGDLHVVMVDTAKVSMQDAVPYLNALKAYWQGPTFGKRALAKNGIILVIGVSNNTTIDWAEASTGMPFGNENMIQHIRGELPGTSFTPTAVFGQPKVKLDGKKVEIIHPSTPGMLEHIVFDEVPFARASMYCEDDDDSCVGFKDLLSTIEPTKSQKTWMVVIADFLSLVMWVLVGFTSFVETLFRGKPTEDSDYVRPTYSYDEVINFDPYRSRDYGRSKRKGKKR
jgi:hypothetical protein